MIFKLNKLSWVLFVIFMLTTPTLASDFTIPVTVSDGSHSVILELGVNYNGTDDYDPGLDLYYPPKPPGGFDGRISKDGEGYRRDIRKDDITEKTFVVEYQPSENGAIVLTWNSSGLAALGKFTITDDITGELYALDMTTTDTLEVASSSYIADKLRIIFSPLHEIQQFKITADDGAASDGFGCSVSLFGEYAIVGAYRDNYYVGSAYIFKRDGTGWTQEAKLVADDSAIHDNFGSAVSISGEYAIVGAPGDDKDRIQCESGSAYIFKREGGSWIQQAKLRADDSGNYDRFGSSVFLSGEYAIVGAYDNGGTVGAAYIFRREGSSWIQEAKLTADDGAGGDNFGNSVSLSGEYAIVGAYKDDYYGFDSGSAYIFRREGDSWIQEAKLIADDGIAYGRFGCSVSLSGEYAIVGACWDDDHGSKSGSAYIFKRDGTSWTQQTKLTAFDGVADDQFGGSVSLSGEYAIVGAYGNDTHGNESGSVYIFKLDETSWSQQTKLTAYDGETGDGFGGSVFLSDKYAIIGARGDDDRGDNSGSAYIYELSSSMPITPDGGVVSLPDGSASTEFPTGATSQDIYVSITKLDDTTTPPANGGFQLAGETYEITSTNAQGTPVTNFADDIEVTLQYDPSALDGIDEQDLKINYYDDTLGQWVELPSIVDTVNHTVTGFTDHLTKFTIFGPDSSIPPEPPEPPEPAIPEPAPILLIITGLIGILVARKKLKKRK